MLVSSAYAQASGEFMGGSQSSQVFMLVALLAMVYFFMIRPQNRRLKAHAAMLASIEVGDEIITGGGIVGKVTRIVNDDDLMVEIAAGTVVTVKRARIHSVPSKDMNEIAKKAVEAKTKKS
ncbi:MAG: preprotein translocase subunit YajC [Alphaproteobacteria bacterium]|nr:preprotein translocase subunit YajC [Alphaproteobacteria bacterium]